MPRSTPVTVTQDSVGPAAMTAGVQAQAMLRLSATASLHADRVTVAVRDALGNNFDFPGAVATTIIPAGTTYLSGMRSLPTGVYEIFGSYEINGTWHPQPSGTLVVTPASVTPPVPPVPVPPTPTPPVPDNPVPSGIPGTWDLVFSDEFDGTALDTTKWNNGWLSSSEFTGPVNGAEDQGYDSKNVSVSGGSLNLVLTSAYGALVESSKQFSFTYGVVEFRVFLPGSGETVYNWPAAWCDGLGAWPATGEMDVMEGLSGGTGCHFQSPQDNGASGNCSNTGSGWHTFAAHWTEGNVDYWYDGVKVGNVSQGITDAPMFMILNNTSGTYGGPHVTPTTMLVDYARVWAAA